MAENMVKITKLQKREETRSTLNSEAYSVHQRNSPRFSELPTDGNSEDDLC